MKGFMKRKLKQSYSIHPEPAVGDEVLIRGKVAGIWADNGGVRYTIKISWWNNPRVGELYVKSTDILPVSAIEGVAI